MTNRVVSFFEKLGKGTVKVAEIAAPEIVSIASHGLVSPSISEPLFAVLHLSHGDKTPMNPLEQFAITMVLGVLNTVVKNPAHRAAMQNQLLAVADDIYVTFGIIPPSRNTMPPSDPVAH